MKGILNKAIDTALSPKAFSTYAAIGVGVTVVMAILNTRKQCKMEYEKKAYEDILEKEYTKEDVKEEIKETFNNYKPTIAAALATVFCINKAENGWVDYSGIINSAYVASERRVAQLRGVAPGLVAATVMEGIKTKPLEENKMWFCLPEMGDFPDLYFQSTESQMWYALYHLNRNYQIRGSASLKEFLSFLDVIDQFDDPVIKRRIEQEGDYFGWDMGWQLDECPECAPWIQFYYKTIRDDEGNDVVMITPDNWIAPPRHSNEKLAYGYTLSPYE